MFKLNRKGRKGFTLVELAVVIVIIGVLASFGVPKFMQSVERSKAAEAFNFLSALQSSQERYLAMKGEYADDYGSLDLQWKGVTAGVATTSVTLQYFTAGAITTAKAGSAGFTAGSTGWSATCTRTGSSGDYGAYTVHFSQDGFDAGVATTNPTGTASTIDPTISPVVFTKASS